MMDAAELQAKATIAAALIASHAVEFRPSRSVKKDRGTPRRFGSAI